MSAENKALVQRWFDRVWNEGRVEGIDEMFAADGVAHGLGQDLHGPSEFKVFHATFRGAFPEVRLQIEDMSAEGYKDAYRFTATGTHRAGDLCFAETGRTVRFLWMASVRITNGRIEIPRFKPKGDMATISARIEGAARNVLEVLAQRPLSLGERLPIDATTATGHGVILLRLQRPMLSEVPFEDWRFNVDGTIRDLAGTMTTRNLAISQGQLGKGPPVDNAEATAEMFQLTAQPI